MVVGETHHFRKPPYCPWYFTLFLAQLKVLTTQDLDLMALKSVDRGPAPFVQTTTPGRANQAHTSDSKQSLLKGLPLVYHQK